MSIGCVPAGAQLHLRPRVRPRAARGRKLGNASGVARVVTEHSFLNGLVAAITGGIYTPVHMTVACASEGASLALPTVRTLAEAEARLQNGEAFLLPLREEARTGLE